LAKAENSGQFPVGYQAGVMANIVSYENNVRAVLSKVTLGEADAGIVYATDIGAASDKVRILPIADDLNVIATYPIAALPDSPQAVWAQAFVDFILSSQGQQVLSEYGFSTVK
jgi:molybdate transport system substrate-binding protein